MKANTKPAVGFIFLIIVVAALSRLIPHPDNFAPITGMALAGAAYLKRRELAFLLPLIAMWFSDLIINNTIYASYFDGFFMMSSNTMWVYGSLAAIVLFGIFILRKVNVKNVFGAALGGSVIFFVISNFGVWMTSTLYPKSLAGLSACYAAAIPFFQNTIAGDLIYTAVIFGAIELGRRYIPSVYSPS